MVENARRRETGWRKGTGLTRGSEIMPQTCTDEKKRGVRGRKVGGGVHILGETPETIEENLRVSRKRR